MTAAEQVVGTNFGFRTDQNSVANLGYFVLYANTGSHTACNLVITPSSAPAPPAASFAAAPTSRPAPLAVQFTDTSSGDPTSWAWDFDNDGTTDSVEWIDIRSFRARFAYRKSFKIRSELYQCTNDGRLIKQDLGAPRVFLPLFRK